MNRPRIPFLLAALAAGLVVGAAVPVFSHSAGSKVTNLLTVALSTGFTPDREVLIDVVEIPPNQKLDWHRHPGEEFHYYLEGDPVILRRLSELTHFRLRKLTHFQTFGPGQK